MCTVFYCTSLSIICVRFLIPYRFIPRQTHHYKNMVYLLDLFWYAWSYCGGYSLNKSCFGDYILTSSLNNDCSSRCLVLSELLCNACARHLVNLIARGLPPIFWKMSVTITSPFQPWYENILLTVFHAEGRIVSSFVVTFFNLFSSLEWLNKTCWCQEKFHFHHF